MAYDDYEQSEQVQNWLRKNGVSIIVGIAIGLIAIFGWQQWRSHQVTNQVEAGEIYQQIQSAQQAGRIADADKLTQQLESDYAKSPYAVFAAGDRAARMADAGQWTKARDSLKWAIEHAREPALKSLSQLRMAKVQLDAGDAKAALGTLDGLGDKAYRSMSGELRGDVLVKLDRPAEARKAYEGALAQLSEDAPMRGVLQLKIDNLASAGKQGA